jgi:hypothetical protein
MRCCPLAILSDEKAMKLPFGEKAGSISSDDSKVSCENTTSEGLARQLTPTKVRKVAQTTKSIVWDPFIHILFMIILLVKGH